MIISLTFAQSAQDLSTHGHYWTSTGIGNATRNYSMFINNVVTESPLNGVLRRTKGSATLMVLRIIAQVAIHSFTLMKSVTSTNTDARVAQVARALRLSIVETSNIYKDLLQEQTSLPLPRQNVYTRLLKQD